ncbi:uncharacterized protein N7515_007978 [Penicillium bovifimosum]|uniref:Uncharacterized protein n=1 Tax=Penicillium bovifimosum TaxID=126998 RepID=A0A9W9GMB1_9EURO|nr:uncharacterized protein N7515_007978 [Penicillium bovifimosum]KAJ5124153.1 hypothetical protein N7515_007978 [Penicillium bovifimosum]
MLEALRWLAQGNAVRRESASHAPSQPIHEGEVPARHSPTDNRQDPSQYPAVHTAERTGLNMLTRAEKSTGECASTERTPPANLRIPSHQLLIAPLLKPFLLRPILPKALAKDQFEVFAKLIGMI